jgi:hypothetical protein
MNIYFQIVFCVFFAAVLLYSIYLMVYGTPDPHFEIFKSFLTKYKDDRTLDVQPVLEKLKGTRYHDELISIINKMNHIT